MSVDVVTSMCREEFKAYVVYSVLSKSPFIPRRYRDFLVTASRDEHRHYEFWRSIVGECAGGFSKLKVFVYAAILLFFGLTVVFKLLESGESRAKLDYTLVKNVDPLMVERVIADEEVHEKFFIQSIDESRIKYLGSITLGITDAIVELTGIYTGSLGAFSNNTMAGLIGLIAGLSASISMGVASYTQAKQVGILKPLTASFYTAISYMIVAALLALPYFIVASMLHAFVAMILVAVGVIAYMSFYASVLQGRKYHRELLENTTLVLGVSVLLYMIGSAIRSLLEIPFT